MDCQVALACSIISSTINMSRLVMSCRLSCFFSRPLKRLSLANVISCVTNGRTVLSGIFSTSKDLPVRLRIATCLATASPGTNEVATEEPGCMT